MPVVRPGAIFWEHSHCWTVTERGSALKRLGRAARRIVTCPSSVWTERSHSPIIVSARSDANVHFSSAAALTASLELFGASEASVRTVCRAGVHSPGVTIAARR